MRANIGRWDRGVRVAGAVALAGACATGVVSRAWCPALLGIATVLALTAAFRFCGVYGACEIDTLDKKGERS